VNDNPQPIAPQRPARRRKEARPGEILRAALEIFAERGFAAARIDDVAARAGVSKGTVYLYFDSKEALFKAVVTETIGSEIDRAEMLMAAYSGKYAVLFDQLLGMISTVINRNEIAAIPKIVIAEAGNFPDLAKFYLNNVVKRALAIFSQIIEGGIATGEFRAVDVKQAARVLVAPMLFALLWRQCFEPVDDEAFDVRSYFEAHHDLVLAALKPRMEAAQ